MNVLNLFKYYAPQYKGGDNLSFYYQGSIYFQKPIKFNDPWDCKAPHITIPRKENQLKDLWFSLKNQNIPALTGVLWQKIEKLHRNKKQQMLEKHFKEAFERLRSEIGVFSLSFIPDCELMWSHYASSHSGYMLHFQIDIHQHYAGSDHEDVGKLIPVTYKGKREVWNFANYKTNILNYAYDLIRFKSKAWSYECELRLLNVNKYGFIKTPSNWLKSIVIGIDTDSKLRDNLEDIGNSLDVPVLSSVMNKKEYKIDIPGLGINGRDGRTRYGEVKDSELFDYKPS